MSVLPIICTTTDMRTSAKRYFINGKRVAKKVAFMALAQPHTPEYVVKNFNSKQYWEMNP